MPPRTPTLVKKTKKRAKRDSSEKRKELQEVRKLLNKQETKAIALLLRASFEDPREFSNIIKWTKKLAKALGNGELKKLGYA